MKPGEHGQREGKVMKKDDSISRGKKEEREKRMKKQWLSEVFWLFHYVGTYVYTGHHRSIQIRLFSHFYYWFCCFPFFLSFCPLTLTHPSRGRLQLVCISILQYQPLSLPPSTVHCPNLFSEMSSCCPDPSWMVLPIHSSSLLSICLST